MKKGRLDCVGLGITLGAHITPEAMSVLANADVVFTATSSGIVEEWVKTINKNTISLQTLYAEGKSRKQTYNDMVDMLLKHVRAGENVCGAFYGHPGVFALAPHKAIKKAKAEGFEAKMQPGISAEDCLIADLGLDPGATGCQQFETSQFMFYHRVIDPACMVILWQIGLAGDQDSKAFSTDTHKLKELISLLSRVYSLEHEVIVYEAKVLAIDETRIEKIKLKELADIHLTQSSTLVIPPKTRLIDIKLENSVE
ncbi:MAG: hypothetical protein HWD86_05025 [Kangiellaceae bacterium]|nr:hypothetical protein [Kangiellaceae bacterium]